LFVFVVGALVGEDEGFSSFESVALSPVRLVEDEVDVFDVDRFCLSSDGFNHAAEAEVLDSSEIAVTGFVNEVEGTFGESVMRKSDAVELMVDKGDDVAW